jgi:hypothetical protein
MSRRGEVRQRQRLCAEDDVHSGHPRRGGHQAASAGRHGDVAIERPNEGWRAVITRKWLRTSVPLLEAQAGNASVRAHRRGRVKQTSSLALRIPP